MIDILSTSQVLLREAGFTVHLRSVGEAPTVCFEDEALIGFCRSFEKPQDLINEWEAFEAEILNRFAPDIRIAGDKAWNVYCAFLCAAPAEGFQRRAISWIDEDLQRTRKIAACGIASREDLVRILLPVLPLQYQPMLQQEDPTERLRRRISEIAPQAAHVVLDPSVPELDVVRLLSERQ